MRTTRTVPLAPIRLRAEVAPSDTGKRRAQATIYTGAEMERFDFFDGPYTLRLAMKGADLSRFNAGAPVTRNHSGDLDDVVGVTERGWVEGGSAYATLRLSDRDDVATLWADMQNGIIHNVSMDVALLEVTDVTKRGGKKALLATKWQPIGLAIVPAGADPGAQMAALTTGPTHNCVIKENTMRFKKCPACSAKLAPEGETELAECPECEVNLEEAERDRDELARRGEVHRLAAHYKLGDVWAQQQIRAGTPREDLVTASTEERARRAPPISNFLPMEELAGSPAEQLGAQAEALVARARGAEPKGQARRFYGERIVELAYRILHARGAHRGLDVRHHPGRIVELAHTTSDFPLLLGNVLNKFLLPAHETAQPTYRLIAARKSFNDFRAHRFLRRGDFPLPLQVGEGGEIKLGTLGENQEQVTVLTFGRIFSISRQALVNDDLGALQDLAVGIANRFADFENAYFFQQVVLPASGLGPNLSDGVAVYNSAHGNVAGAGALDVTRLGDGRAKMMVQKGIPSNTGAADGVVLNIGPKFLLVSPASLTLAEQLVAPLAPAQTSNANPFSGQLTPIGDANLTGTRFYLLADPARLPQYVYGYLEGATGPRVAVRPGWEVEGVEVKAVVDFGVGAIEYRAGVTGAGA